MRGDLLPVLESLLLAEHRALHQGLLGEPWSPPLAYRWMRYESPDPWARLLAAGHALAREWRAAADRPGYPEARAAFRAAEAPLLAAARRTAARLGLPLDPGRDPAQ